MVEFILNQILEVLKDILFFGRRPPPFIIVLPPAGVGGMTSIKTHHPSFHGAFV